MKKSLLFLLIIFQFSCTTNDDGTNSSLPAITSEGKNTLGCKINGETFLPINKGGFSGGYRTVLSAKYAHYENEYYGLGPGYHLSIHAYNSLTNKSVSIRLIKSDSPLIPGETYPITLKSDGTVSAEYNFSTNTQSAENPNIYIHESYNHITTNEYNGEITFHHIDEENQIISGEFYFDCIDTNVNKMVKITEGRFDLIYKPYF
jgi:hypothetical protein